MAQQGAYKHDTVGWPVPIDAGLWRHWLTAWRNRDRPDATMAAAMPLLAHLSLSHDPIARIGLTILALTLVAVTLVLHPVRSTQRFG